MGNLKMSQGEAERFAATWREHIAGGGNESTLMGIARSTMQNRRRQVEHLLDTVLLQAGQKDTVQATQEAREQKAELMRLRASAADVERLRALYQGGLDYTAAPPNWLYRETVKAKCLGTPTLFLSDLHWGEHVDPKQINYANQFDMKIARARLRRVFETTIRMLYQHLAPANYLGMVLALGGDMVSGNIHEELRETNDDSILAIVLDLFDCLVAGIDMLLAAGIPMIFIPCVVGNHGRLDKKPRAKGAVQDNYEWILYQLLMRHYATEKRVTVVPSDSLDYLYQIHNTTYLLTHGDQFKGGSGIAGPATPWALGDHKKRKRQNAINQPYDYMIFGHFHQLTWGQTYIVNGSLKGYDEWTFRMNFGIEPPQQALWITHPKHGITVKMEIGAEDNDGAIKESPWVRVRGA